MLPMLNRRRLVVAGVALVLVSCWVLCDLLVVTDREWIDRILDGLADAAETADTKAMMQHLSRDYRAEEIDYEGMQALIHAYFTLFGSTHISYLQRDDISIRGQRAVADVVLWARSASGGRSYAAGRSEWRFHFRKYGDQWQITRIEPIRFDGGDIRGWGDIRSYLR